MLKFFVFVGGAIIPVLPYIFSSGTTAFVLSSCLAKIIAVAFLPN